MSETSLRTASLSWIVMLPLLGAEGTRKRASVPGGSCVHPHTNARAGRAPYDGAATNSRITLSASPGLSRKTWPASAKTSSREPRIASASSS